MCKKCFQCLNISVFLTGPSKAVYPLKGTVTFKEQKGKYFKAFSNIYIYIYIYLDIYMCPCKNKLLYIFVF